MRIVILGDFHLKPEDYELTRSAMEDIANCKPDLMIPLGDFGSQGKIGYISGLEEAEPFLRQPGVPLRPILGNHDLERESGNGEQLKGTIEEHFCQMFELDKPYGVLEYEHVRFFFASTEPQQPDSCYDVQEVFATDEQFAWIKNKLKERPNVPVIFFTHAPPVGSGLRTVPRVHVRSTNAYLDENHDPYRWYHLFKNTPEIVMWFSAHYHLSHIHPDSHTYRFGTHFFITGVHGGSFTRDGMRQSRIVDIQEDSVQVLTLDHIKRAVTHDVEWFHKGHIRSLLKKTEVSLSRVTSMSVGEASAFQGGIIPLSGGRCLVSTEDGFTWEAEPKYEAVFGTYHIGPVLTGIAATDDYIWMSWGNSLGRSERQSPWRFVRDANGAWPFTKQQFNEEVSAMALCPDGGVWAASGLALWKVYDFSEVGKLSVVRVAELQEQSRKLISDGHSLWSLSSSGVLYGYDGQKQLFEPYMENVQAWDCWKVWAAGLCIENGELLLKSWEDQDEYTMSLKTLPVQNDDMNLLVLCLGNHHVLVLVDGQVFFVKVNQQSMKRLETAEGRVTSIARSYNGSREDECSSFYMGLDANNIDTRPKLELWEKIVHH
ncbi:metallophosphoesterase family protein [Paenibacillus agricola]|uniref:Metallophosphoesterase n=1 Tax=Paenibacillus agricola TaxID=2716264 RepID=A0ABX0JKP7_9BACL|nr:metallophosphoesterase [Paenibacillus agricola]NHN34646.1 metallophosphoesterase [Paenibacillus agricola]